MTKSPFMNGFVLLCLLLAGLPLAAAAQFADLTSGPLVTTGTTFGVAWGDFDKDGDLDLFMAKGSSASKLVRNDGTNVFTDITTAPVGGTGGDMSSTIVDYDDDGDLDIYVANSNWASRMLRNDAGTFVSVNAGDATATYTAQSAAWADYDRDGDLDLFVTCWNQPDHLYRNDGAGILHDVTPPVLADPQNNTGAAWGDFDNDRDPDLYVGGRVSGKLYRNDAGTFVNVTDPLTTGKAGVNGVAWGDEDDDGDLDLYLARDLNSSRLLRNDSTPGVVTFIDLYIPAVRDPGAGQGTTWIDYDADGDLDIFLAKAGADNGSGQPNALFRNNGGDSFTDVSAGAVVAVANSRGVACGDYDGNGTPDLYVANWNSSNQLLSSTIGPGSHWTEIRLIGTQSNSQGIGARVRVVAGTHKMVREISGGSGIYSQNAPVALVSHTYYTSTTVDSVVVFWPSGLVTDTTNVPINQIITMRETPDQTGVGDDPLPVIARLLAASPNPFRAGTSIAYELSQRSPVRLMVMDAQGRLLRVLESTQSKEPGRYSERWDGRNEAGYLVAPGVYFYALSASGLRQSYPIVLVR